MARIRTLDFLPEIFQTPSNSEFLAATLDQIVNPPSTMRIQGYVGSKLGYGINPTNDYVIEPTKTRTDYQLDPAVVFTKKDESIAKDFISYPGMIDALNLQGAVTEDNSKLFESQFYSWDSFTDLDKLINYNQYYWLPDGAPAVTVGTATVFNNENYIITDLPVGYNIAESGTGAGAINPTITLLRGGVYTFTVNQNSQFWIQGEPGVTGYSAAQTNLYTREIYGVSNNGAEQGVITFAVPAKNAQDEYNFPYNTTVDVVSDLPFNQVNGVKLSSLPNGIDGVTGINGLTVLFYNTGALEETAYTSIYMQESPYDTNLGLIEPVVATVGSCDSSSFTLSSGTTDMFYVVDPITGVTVFAQPTITFDEPGIGGVNPGQVYFVNNIINSTQFTISESLYGPDVVLTPETRSVTVNINQGLLEEGYYSQVNQNFYQVEYVGDPNDPVLRLKPVGLIPTDTKITPTYGSNYIGLGFYKSVNGYITKIPYISAPKDILYYQDSVSPNKVGTIRLIESNITNTLDVEADILGKKNFTSTNGVVFTNGLKVKFDGDVFPASYLKGEYYVEGVGTSINLVPVDSLVVPEKFSTGIYNPYDISPYDTKNYDIDLYVPIDKDYITIARNSINKNAWSRSNRWFHIDVIRATAKYNDNPSIATTLGAYENKATRPIIEFYPNLKLFNSGSIGKQAIDFFDTRQADALTLIPGTRAYYPDVETYTAYTATIDSAPFATSIDITVPEKDITGLFQLGMYVGDTAAVLPPNSQITNLQGAGSGTLTITVSWSEPKAVFGATNASIVGTDTTVDNYQVFSGSRIIFSNDADEGTKTKIYVVEIEEVVSGQGPVITLSLAEDYQVLPDDQVSVSRGYNYQGKTFYNTGTKWVPAQQKVTVNQAPLFDVFDENGISFGDTDVYNSSSFAGNKLFAYGISDSTIDDPVLGFPVRYSSIDNVGDISFDVSLNLDTFDYVAMGNPITQKVNTGYVYNYVTRTDYTRLLGWETAIAPSTQYQVFSFDYNEFSQPSQVTCDIAALPALAENEAGWPRIQVYFNNEFQQPENYSVSIGANSTTITLLTTPNDPANTQIQVLLLSDQVSSTAYYTIPVNLSNNPFNGDLTKVNVGDIRQQYRDIFINAPGTTGEVFGSNNVRDLGNLVPYGTKIIQNSASLVLPGTFLRKKEHDLFNALLFNSREYIKFKQLIVDTVQNTDYVQRYTPSIILDDALDQITAAKSQINAFFWSDMLPSKSPYRTNVYTFANSLDTSIYPLSQIYNFESANYNGVLVYLTRTVNGLTAQQQLLRGVDYVVSTDSPSLTVTLDLLPGDQITVQEYNQTYGSYVPNTPTKLGLYQAFEPAVILDSNYAQPTYFIRGHDGSYTKLYGQYIPEANVLVDFRDQALLEFEKRIYNNLKLSTEVPIREYEVLPGFFRQNSTYSWEQFLEMYSPGFLNWVGQNRIDYKTQFFNKVNEWTYNYTNSQNKLDRSPILQGYWRGVYQYLYDTTTPDSTPWEMLGFSEEPSWWTARYGPAPYTSDNLILWGDLESGLVWNNGNSYVVPELARPGLSKILPVNSNGELLTPFVSTVANYNPSTFQKDWKVGDMGPAELSYRRSSTWPFDLVKLFALTRPAEFFNLAVDLDNYKYSAEFNQYLVNNRSHLVISDVEIYGNGTAKTSYINWIVDYEKQLGIPATENITTLLDNLDVRLAYRLAGFSDKSYLKFYVEKGSPNSNNASLLIPDESYGILLYDNQAYDQLMFTGVVIQKTQDGWSVYGNSQTYAYFTVLDPVYTGNNYTIQVDGASVKITHDYSTTETLVPYGTVFYSYQEVAQFILSYAAYLKSKGMIFDVIEDGREVNWDLMVQDFLYWIQLGWENGSVITLNPAANNLKINRESTVVQPLTMQQQNFILNQDLYPIQMNNLCVHRNGTEFNVNPLNTGDSISYGQFNLNNFEHAVVFDNVTLFNDTIYNLITGLKQNRVNVSGTKTAEWNGTVNAYGFILNQDNVQDWSPNVKYTKGQIVKYKNRYYSALEIIQPASVFEELKWALVDYENIQKGMLPNASTRAYESTLYYDVNKANLEQDTDLLSYSLIGYRPRDYLALVDLTDITQINVYRNLIRNKGTRNATLAFKGANLPQGGIDYDVYENWAIKSSEFGGTLNENFVEFRVNQNYLTGNPSIVSLTDGVYTPGSNQEIPLYSLYNYGRPITTPDILNTTALTNPNPLYPNAGYVNFNDVEMASYYFAGLPAAVDASGVAVPINSFYVRDYMWLANFKEKWGVYSWKPIGQVLQVSGNLNNTATVTFAQPHNLKRLDPLSIINFATNVDGYYIVTEVLGLNQVVINLSINNQTSSTIQGYGIGLSFINQRVSTPADIKHLDLLEAEFQKNTVWVDENTDGSWAVYRKSINYKSQGQLELDNGATFGSAVAYTPNMGYLISDSGNGVLYRYAYNSDNDQYNIAEEITNDVSFGSKIVYANDIYVVSEPTSATPTVYVYTLNKTVLSDDIVSYQSISAPAGVTEWGSELAISDDSNWIYVSSYTPNTGIETDNSNRSVYVYRKQNINLTAGYFVPGKTYVITEVGNTDWTSIGATYFNGDAGYTFVATGIGSGTGTAMQVTYELVNIIDSNDLGLVSADGFGKSLSTDQAGDLLVVGAPNKNFSGTIQDNGAAYVYQRTVQNVEAQYNSLPSQPHAFRLAWTPAQTSTTVVSTTAPYTVKLTSVTDIKKNDPIFFTGLGLGGTGISTNQVYYVAGIPDTLNNTVQLKASRSTDEIVVVDSAATITGVTATAQTTPLYITVNGTLVDDINYATVGSMLYYAGTLQAGDIINISDDQFNMVQVLNSDYADRTNIRFGYDLDVNKQGSDILVGSPNEIDSKNREGAVYRFTNGGAKHGIVVGTTDCNILGNRNLLINGYLVELTPGDAEHVANVINSNQITNIQAASSNGKIIIQVINTDLTQFNEKLVITAFDNDTLSELGLQIFTKTQIITCPHESGATQFGSAIKINDAGSVVISAPVGTRYEGTTFDFTDDEQLDNDTVFDNNATRFVDNYPNAGAVYMFDFLGQNNESLLNPGAYIYAQSINSNSLDYGFGPEYGYAVDFNENVVMVGSPAYQPVTVGGQVVIYANGEGTKDWSIYRQSAPIVDIEKIENSQLFSAETNDTLVNLDYMDPLQGKLLGTVRQNIDYVSSVDPAKYNSNLASITGQVWGAEHVGEIWFNTNNVRFMNYHQDDPAYNAKYWGSLFPGSDVAVYTWVASNVPPGQYQGTGTPLDVNLFSVSSALNASGLAAPVYYFWVRNSNVISRKLGKTLSDSVIASYISNPRNSGVAYMAPILPNAFALYNCAPYVNANDSVLHVGFANGSSNDVAHNEYTLIRENYPDDFLPGLPSSILKHGNVTDINSGLTKVASPYGLYSRMLDSLSGCDDSGQVVPNPFLPKAVQSGILARPRQSFFFNRFKALNNYLVYANTVLAQFPIAETRPNASFLLETGVINPSTMNNPNWPGIPQLFYDTKDYWEYVNWWAPGYDDNTKALLVVPEYADLTALDVPAGTIVRVAQNGAGKFEFYRLDIAVFPIWTRIGLENGTIRFKTNLWDYTAAKLGYSGDFFDTAPYDTYPSEETRNIVRALNEQIYIDELIEYRNKSLVLLFEYIQSETTESQNFLPWLNKTSLVDVSHTIRELLPIENLKTDNQDFLEGYLNEVKPYHVVIKDFLFKYTGIDTFEGDITDFDLPAQYSPDYQKFISPQLVYGSSGNEYEYSVDSTIWQDTNYNQWFANHGVSIVGEPNYQITTLRSYMDPSSKSMVVDNASGFPINGVIKIGSEKISYSYVDRALNVLSGLLRGVNGTPITEHLPGAQISIDLPAVLLLDGGRGYTEPPKVTAYIDTTKYPEPSVPAQLEAVMSLDSVLQVNVINPGQGYAVLPEIRIDPAYTVYFNDTNVNNELHTINVYAPNLRTGDIIQYKQSLTGAPINKLDNNQWYYVGVLENSPSTIIALYTNYGDALQDHDRIDISTTGVSVGMSLNAGAKASAVTSASPVRENNITLRFDRTTYDSQVVDWKTGAYYGSFFAGNYFNSEKVSSSSILLDSDLPTIDSILASAQGVAFEISNVENNRQLQWTSATRKVERTSASNNTIRLSPASKSFTGVGSIADTTLNITSITDGTIEVGSYVYGPNIAPETQVVSQLSGTIGGVGLYQISVGQTASSEAVYGFERNASGTTMGFYTGMPVKFEGYAVGGLVDGVEYYVDQVINNLDFTISATDGGPTMTLASADLGLQTLLCYAGEVVDTAILTVNYPGILNVTATQAGTNILTVPISEIGTGGTSGFYTNLPIFFTGNVFGGVIENDPYYITTVIDNEHFTISKTENPLTVEVLQTIAATSTIALNSTSGFNVNDEVIFTGTTFGNIVAGTVYYVREVISATQLTLSLSVNGPLFTLSDATPAAETKMFVVSQKDTIVLATDTGSMTMNVSLPVSPGQVDGQLFTLYNTSVQYPNINNGLVGNLIARDISATIGEGLNRVAISSTTGGTENFYINMPITISAATTVGGNLVPGTTYYVSEYSGQTIPDPIDPSKNIVRPNIEVTVLNTTSESFEGVLTCSTIDTLTPTDTLYPTMPIVFSGTGLGGIVAGQQYFVESIINGTQFKITDVSGAAPINLETDNGTMKGTGDPYIVLVDAPGGSEIVLVDEQPLGATLNQAPNTSTPPVFSISYVLGGYRAIIEDGSSGFAINNTIKILGTNVGGTSPANDLLLTVNTINETTGAITDVIINGNVPSLSSQYYMKVISANKFAVYSDPLMEVPVSGIDFRYTGFTTNTVVNITSGTNKLTLADASGFEVNDSVVFTGELAPAVITPGPETLVRGRTYYITSLAGNDITISATPGGTDIDFLTTIPANFTIAKAGSFALLPEPFYFTPSIVKYLGRVWVCVISNNDDEFILGKWEELRSGDRRLNALDRVIGYYQPTVNMPGVDLTQLFDGIIYPNSIYKGNAFEPNQQFPIDSVLQDQSFYPTEVDLSAIVYDGEKYIAPANLPNYSAIIGSIDNENWVIGKLTNAGIGITDIIYAGGYYVMTSTNSATPIFRSNNGIEWTTNGYYTPYGSLPYDTSPYDMTALSVSALALNSIGYFNGYYVAGGDNIVRSDDTYIWRKVTDFNPTYNYQIFGINTIETQNFTGILAVGKGKMPDYSTGVTQLIDTGLIFYSNDSGETWNQVDPITPNGFNGVASNGSLAIAVGEQGAIYYSENGANWFGITESSIISVNSITNQINITSAIGLTVNDTIVFNNSFSNITAGTVYYVSTVDSSTQITISDTLGGPVKDLSASGNIPVHTLVRLYDPASPVSAELRDIIYVNNVWIAVGDNGTVKTSTNYINWTSRPTGTTNSLKGITYNEITNSFTVVGDSNTIITSSDNGVTWTNVSLFTIDPPVYNVQGSPFEFGYGPEELVPGVVSDDLSMIVTTKSGINWPVVEYGYSGFNVKSVELTPAYSTQTVYNFNNVVEYPTQLTVQVINAVTKLATTLDSNDYTIDWVNKTVTLAQPLTFLPADTLRIEVYEAGNGNQLIKSSTDVDPIRQNALSGFDEIYLNCNYSAPIYEGGGAIRPGTVPVSITATATSGDTNRILCDSVSDFVLNMPIMFQGVTFGNIQEDQIYTVKSISAATNTITVSLGSPDPITGLAGPIFDLTTATGTMYAIINPGAGLVWATPLVMHNGQKLLLGTTGLVTKTSSINNSLTTTTTAGMYVGERITFCAGIFDPNVSPLTTYYVKEIIDINEFTISATLGGPVITLSDSFGGSRFVTNDFAFGTQPNGYQAKIIFSTNAYTNGQDYLVYSIMGEQSPIVQDYSNPEIQEFVGDGVTTAFKLTNYCGGTNPNNAVVEVNGLRQINYTIDPVTSYLLMNESPAIGASVRVTTYNDTDYQYLTTQYGITNSPGTSILSLEVGATRHTEIRFDDLASPTGSLPTVSGEFVIGQTYVIETLGTTDFTLIGALSNTIGEVFVATGPGTGTGTATVAYDAPSQLPVTTYLATELAVGNSYEIVSLGTTTDWNDIAGSTGYTYSVGDIVTVVNPGTGDGTASRVNSIFDEVLNWLSLSTGDTSSLSVGDSIIFTGSPSVFGNIVQGKTYYVVDIWSTTEFVISETPGGAPLELTNASGSMAGNVNPFNVIAVANINNVIVAPIAQTVATATDAITNEITVLSTDNFLVDQSVEFKSNTMIGGLIPGKIYFIESIVDGTTFTIKDKPEPVGPGGATQVSLLDGAGTMVVTVGGSPTTTITTTTPIDYQLNTKVRLDGITGATQLNGNAYYVRPVTDTVFELYLQAYQSGLNDTNYPVTGVSNYEGGGYIWQQGILYLVSAYATETSSIDNRISVESTENLIENTPVYFSEAGAENNTAILGGLVQGKVYYIKQIFPSPFNQITVSETQYGDIVELTDDTGYINLTQWNQTDVDRVWVTVNGYRVPSSHLRLYNYNELGILSPIGSGDVIVITNMIPTSTPNEEVYINFVNQVNEGIVYRENVGNRTYLTKPIYDLSTEIYVNDVNSVTDQLVQNVTVGTAIDGYYNFGLTASRDSILTVQVMNNTTGQIIDQSNYSVVIENLAPILKVSAGSYINVGDQLTITTLVGGTILVNGEQINFGSVDLVNNTLGNLQRGANGTAKQYVIPTYTVVYGLLPANKLGDTYYYQTWRTPVYDDQGNIIEYLPLQVSVTDPALFLKSDTYE